LDLPETCPGALGQYQRLPNHLDSAEWAVYKEICEYLTDIKHRNGRREIVPEQQYAWIVEELRVITGSLEDMQENDSPGGKEETLNPK
jgi:hypothetical protein